MRTRSVVASIDGGDITSDVGVLLVTAALTAAFTDNRDQKKWSIRSVTFSENEFMRLRRGMRIRTIWIG